MDVSSSKDTESSADQQSSCQEHRTELAIIILLEIANRSCVSNSLPATQTAHTQESDVPEELESTDLNETADSSQLLWPDFMQLPSSLKKWISRKFTSCFASLRSSLRHLVYGAVQHVDDGSEDDDDEDNARYRLTERGMEYLRLYGEITADPQNVLQGEDLHNYVVGLLDSRSGMTMEDLACLPIKTYEVASSASPDQFCTICLENYEPGDDMRTLPCFHEFHQQCIDKWLMMKPVCPDCKEDVVLVERL